MTMPFLPSRGRGGRRLEAIIPDCRQRPFLFLVNTLAISWRSLDSEIAVDGENSLDCQPHSKEYRTSHISRVGSKDPLEYQSADHFHVCADE